MRRKKISHELLLLAILTVITVSTWIAFDVYRALRQPAPPKVAPEQLLPLDPKLETAVMENLSQREMLGKEGLVLPATESGKTR